MGVSRRKPLMGHLSKHLHNAPSHWSRLLLLPSLSLMWPIPSCHHNYKLARRVPFVWLAVNTRTLEWRGSHNKFRSRLQEYITKRQGRLFCVALLAVVLLLPWTICGRGSLDDDDDDDCSSRTTNHVPITRRTIPDNREGFNIDRRATPNHPM